MGVRGPKPMPIPIRRALGNPGHRPMGEEPPARKIRPDRPTTLSAPARRHWDRLVPELEHMGVLTVVDGSALGDLCETEAMLSAVRVARKRRRRYLARAATGYESPDPLVSLEVRLMREARAARSLFGLSPIDRTRLATRPGEGADDGDVDG